MGRGGGDGFVLYFDISMKQHVFSEPQSLKVAPLRLRDENPRIHIVTPKSLCINPKQSSYTIFLKSNTKYYLLKIGDKSVCFRVCSSLAQLFVMRVLHRRICGAQPPVERS